MTVIRPNSISGITSLTAHRGSIDFYAHDGSAATFDNINSNVTSGVSTFASLNITGDLDVGGALTYEDVTNVDSVGVITARNGIDVTGGTVTITTGANSASPAGSGDNLVIKDSNGCGLSILSGNGNSQNIYLGSVSDNDAVRLEGFYNSGSPYFNIYTAGSERLRIDSNGNMGLGTNSPNNYNNYHTLTINGASGGEIDFESGGTLIADAFANNGGYYFTTRTSIPIRFYTTNSGGTFAERLRITANGDVGIGEDNPSTPLHVAGSLTLENSSATGNAWTYYKNADRTWLVGVRGSSNDALSFYDLTTDVERLRIASDGKVGINETSPSYRLHITETTSSSNYAFIQNTTAGNAGIRLKNSQGDFVVFVSPDFRIYDWANSTDRLRISNTGNVGINEGNPRAKLDVRGTALIADDIGSTLPSTFPASDVQLMVYTSTNGQPISNTNCARILLATDAKQTGPQGYNGAIDFGNSDCTASGGNNQYNYRVASIMSQALGDTESNAADGNLEFWTKTSTGSLSQKMGISAEGYVTKPAHPCFDAVRNSGNMSANVYINYNTAHINIGNCYNVSNGRFTAPVDGYYFFSWGTIKNNINSTVTRLYIHKNGSVAYGSRHLRMDSGQDYGDNGAMTVVIQLAKNDYVQIYLGAGQIYGVTQEYCYFNGYLLG